MRRSAVCCSCSGRAAGVPNKFHAPLPLASLWILATYWVAQFMIDAFAARGAD